MFSSPVNFPHRVLCLFVYLFFNCAYFIFNCCFLQPVNKFQIGLADFVYDLMVFPKSYATLTIFVYVDQFFLGIPYFCD